MSDEKPVQVEIRHTCALCGARVVDVKIEDLDPQPAALTAKYGPRDPDKHKDCFTHIRCPNCSPGWWAACIRLRLKDSKLEAKGPPS